MFYKLVNKSNTFTKLVYFIAFMISVVRYIIMCPETVSLLGCVSQGCHPQIKSYFAMTDRCYYRKIFIFSEISGLC